MNVNELIETYKNLDSKSKSNFDIEYNKYKTSSQNEEQVKFISDFKPHFTPDWLVEKLKI